MRDFTFSSFELLLTTLKEKGYTFITFEEFLRKKPSGKQIILRHDVDKKPLNSLMTAQIENRLGVKGTYYFRILKQSNNPAIIRSVAALGHEIGYHYEDLVLAKGKPERAIQLFEKNLNYFREFYPVKTICMHGSPLSKWNNHQLWESYNYKDYGLLGEPYLEIDFNSFFYLTDTGRKWNTQKANIRDKVQPSHHLRFYSTFDIISHADNLPRQLMITTHPQRWENKLVPWIMELVFQNCKNFIKGVVISPKE